MKKINWGYIYIITSVLFAIFMITFYGYRFFHFKKDSKVVDEKVTNINEILISKVVYTGDGLYKDNDNYYFKGKEVSNYVDYSNRLFRIVSIEDGNIKMVIDTPETIIDSNSIHDWLDKYLEGLDNELITEYNYCSDKVNENITCDNKELTKIGLLTLKDYELIGNTNSFVNNGYYTWLSTENDNNNHWYITDTGEVAISEADNTLSVKPVITLKANLDIIHGDGSVNSPYTFKTYTDIRLGSYIKYSDMLWKVNKIDDNYALIKEETLEEPSIYSNHINNYDTKRKGHVANYLNNEYLNKLDKNSIKNIEYNNGIYTNNYNNITINNVKTYVGLPNIGDLFIVGDKDTYTMNPTGKATQAMNVVLSTGRVYSAEINEEYYIRPVITISKVEPISGSGTYLDPFIVK
jgi:hypothetical protein